MNDVGPRTRWERIALREGDVDCAIRVKVGQRELLGARRQLQQVLARELEL
jgi:hypothetical protein